jgi:predicted nucleic acid-binding protein
VAGRRIRRLPANSSGILVLDSGAMTKIANHRDVVARLIWKTLVADGWRTCIPSVTLGECITGRPREDTNINRLVREVGASVTCDDVLARAAGRLRFVCRRTPLPSVTDALVAAVAARAQPSIVLTTDPRDISALLTRVSQAKVIGI